MSLRLKKKRNTCNASGLNNSCCIMCGGMYDLL